MPQKIARMDGVSRAGTVRANGDQVIELVPHRPAAQREASEVTLEDGQYLFRQGDPSDVVYLVDSGKIGILREAADGTQEHDSAHPGYFLNRLFFHASLPALRPTLAIELPVMIIPNEVVVPAPAKQPAASG